MRIELINKIIKIISEEGFKDIKIEEKEELYKIIIKTLKNKNINFEVNEEEKEILNQILNLDTTDIKDEDEIDTDIKDTTGEIGDILKNWAEYIEEIEEGKIDEERKKILEKEIEVFNRRIILLKQELKLLKREKNIKRKKRIIKEIKRETIQQKVLLIMHQLIIKEVKTKKQKKEKIQTPTPQI